MIKEGKKEFWNEGFLTLANFRDILILILLGVSAWKLFNADISIKFGQISLADITSVLLAFFAIALSVAFYFKATDTSNRFYDNSYAFTREMSEILGRIESGFGEKLRHIDEGYTGLRDKFDRIPFDMKEAKEEEKKEEETIREQEKERDKIILDLMEKAQVADDEKERLLNELNLHARELEKSKDELRRLQRRINSAESEIFDIPDEFITYFGQQIKGIIPPRYAEVPVELLMKRFRQFSNDIFDEKDLSYMEGKGLLSQGRLTLKGAKVMREAIKSYL